MRTQASLFTLAVGLLTAGIAYAEEPAPVDLYGDPLPPGVVARLGTVRLRNASQVASVAFSPDGKVLATGDYLGGVRLWDMTTGKERTRFSVGTEEVGSVSFHDDGKLVATVDWHSALRLWDASTGKERPCLPPTKYPCALSPDGTRVARCAERGRLGICEIATGVETTTIHFVAATGTRFAFSPDGKRLAALDGDYYHLWDAVSGKELARQPTKGTVLVFSPDGAKLAFASGEGEGGSGVIAICDADGRELKTCKGHSGGIDSLQALAFSGDGKLLASASRDATVRVWDVGSGKEIGRFAEALTVLTSVAYCPTRNVIAIASQNGRHVVRLWDVDKQERLLNFPAPESPAEVLTYSPNGRMLASAVQLSDEQIIHLWDPKTGKELPPLRGLDTGTGALAFSPDGKTLASAGDFDRTVRLWDIDSGKERKRLQNEAGVLSVAYSPDGKRLALGDLQFASSGEMTSGIQVWDADLRTRSLGRPGWAHGIAFSSDGALLAVSPGPPPLVDAATGDPRGCLPAFEGTGRFRLSPDGKLAAMCADQAFVVVEVASGGVVFRHEAAVGVIPPMFAPNGWVLAFGGQDRRVTLLDAWTGEEAGTFPCPANAYRLAFAPDGRTLASSCEDATILLWDMRRLPGPAKRGVADPNLLSEALFGRDSHAAWKAAAQMVASPTKSVAFLKEHTPAVVVPNEAAISRMIAALDNDDFDVRERASRQLEAQGQRVEDALRQALAGSPTPEVRQRIQILLPKVKDQPAPFELLSALRATAVLERIASPEARELLREWSEGQADADRTREAKAALQRLGRRDTAER